ncbi:glycosyltransferase family 4 protein [Thermincola ferriacetica]
MKVAFNAPQTFNQVIGGAEIQLLKTKKALEELGVEVHLFDQWEMKVTDFDLVHNFTGDPSTYPLCSHVKKAQVPLVVSTVYWPVLEYYLFSDTGKKQKLLALGYHFFKKIFSAGDLQRRIYHMADILLPNSATEAKQVARDFGVELNRSFVVPNGVDRRFADAKPDLFYRRYGLKDFVLCVGRIEPRKNQLSVIRALKGTGIPLVIIGEPAYKPHPYYEACLREKDDSVHFLGYISHDDPLLESAYAACHTFVLASWYDTPGLVALEAGLAGARVVITGKGTTRDYFADYVRYVDPRSVRDIREAVLAACGEPKNDLLRNHIMQNFLWENVGQKTLEAYRRILS